MEQVCFCLFKLQPPNHMKRMWFALAQQTLGPYGKVLLKFVSLITETVLYPLVKAPVTPQTYRGGTVRSWRDTEEHHCWCFQHPWTIPQVITALCVPDTQVGMRTQPMANKEMASVPVFTHCVHEAFILLYQLIYYFPIRKKTIKSSISTR